MLLAVIFLTYIAIKYRKSNNKSSMKNALWSIHIVIDKIIKYIDNDWRK
jgi:hypothetical protein